MPSRTPRRFAALAASILALTACAPTDTSHTLVLWHAWGGAELKALKALIGTYQTAHPGTEVMALQVPYDKLKDKYLRSSAANGGPDLLIGDADWSGKFAASDLVLRTDDGFFSKDELARFYPSTLKSLTLNGKMYALPESRETIALYYNKKLMPEPPKTVAALFEAAKGVTAKAPGTYGMVFNAKFYYLMGYFFGAGGRLFDDQDRLAVNSAGGLKALDFLQQVSTASGMLASPEYGKGDGLYKEGKAAMILNGPWALGDYRTALGPDLGVATLPALEEGKPAASWVGVKCMMFNPNADPAHRAMAKDFALYVTSPAGQKTLSEVAGHVPAAKGVELTPGSPLSVFAAQADVGTPVSIRPEISMVWEPMDKVVRQVIEKEAPPAKALADAEAVIKAKLEAVKAQAQ
ncbi:MAG: putative transporter substrate binding protein [Cyanobacteria bacterium RYN_339]|nr:putative transporter substrate binding protein [Cyanobacteria bacterium RYN_339]